MRLLALLLLLAADAVTPEAQLAGLEWMAGTWSGEMWGGDFTAYYSTPKGGKVLGYSVLEKEGKQAFFEFEVFEVRNGKVAYLPYPGGRRLVHLLLTESKQDLAVFENPKKDFPTRITFARKGKLLTITLSDPHNKSDKVETFKLKRAG
ncbi:MAG: DUF6265 family protein [Planctomycetota bacterium]